MGKRLENESPKQSHLNHKEDSESLEDQLPIPLASKEFILGQLRGYNIAIYDGNIVAMDKSLSNLHKTLESLIPKGKRCEIEYIEKGAFIYGSSF